MATIKQSIGQVNITNYLLVILRKTTDPLTEVARQSFAAPHPTVRNIVFTNVEDGVYFIDYRTTDDPGTSLGLLLSTFTQDSSNNTVTFEQKFYTVSPGGDIEPDQDELIDEYLDGKTIRSVYKEGFRPLEPDIEYELITGGGIRMLQGMNFSSSEKFVVDIDYTTNPPPTSGTGLFSGAATVVTSLTLNSTYFNKLIACESPSSRLVLTLQQLSLVPDGKFYYFTTHKGSQLQTKLITSGGELIVFDGADVQEIAIGKSEHLWIEKRGSRWKVINAHAGLTMVGERVGAQMAGNNMLPEDGALYDGDDYPRVWAWLNTKLGAPLKIVDDNVVNGGYTHPDGKEGQFVVHSTLKKFRMPNTQNFFYRNLKGSADSSRPVNFPGGKQLADARVDIVNDGGQGGNYTVLGNPTGAGYAAGNPANFQFRQRTYTVGTETRPINIGEFSYRRI